MTQYFESYNKRVLSALTEMISTDASGEVIGNDKALDKWCEMTASIKQSGHSMYFCGNGASAAMSSHMSADAAKNGQFAARSLHDISLVTAISNDVSYEQVFATQLNRYAKMGDALVTISSSGNSPNIVAAIAEARKKQMTVVTLSGKGKDNKSRKSGDLNFYLPAQNYGIVECGHQVLLHSWLDKYLCSIGVDI